MRGWWCCCRRSDKLHHDHDLLHSEDFEPDVDDDEEVLPPLPKNMTHIVLLQLRARDPARYEEPLFKPQLEAFMTAFGKFDMRLEPARFIHDRITGKMTFMVTGCSTSVMLSWMDRTNYKFLEALLENYYEIIFAAETKTLTNVVFALEPIIRGGVFIAPNLSPSWDASSSPQHAPPQQPSEASFLAQKRADIVGADDYPLAAYWRNVEALVPLVKREQQQQVDADGDVDIEGATDNDGVPLPQQQQQQQEQSRTENVKTVFMRECKRVESMFSPLGIVNAEGTLFRLVFPPGEFGKRLLDKLVDVSAVAKAASARHTWEAQQLIAVSQVLPCPMHVSPLLLALIRDGNACVRFTDAITNASRLHTTRIAVRDMDTENPEHKKRCDNFRRVLELFVAIKFYREVDRVVDAGKIPSAQREQQDERVYFDGLLRQFGAACDQYSIDYVHVLEWSILDMLRVPYALRSTLMTPTMRPPAHVMRPVDFGVLRANLSNYLRNRNEIFCGVYVKDELTKKETYAGNAKDAWNPMQLDVVPKLEDRVTLLAQWVHGGPLSNDDAKKCVFGLHNDWIDLHTLREYLLFLSQDTRGGIKKRALEKRPVLTEAEEAAVASVDVGAAEEMDTGE